MKNIVVESEMGTRGHVSPRNTVIDPEMTTLVTNYKEAISL